MGQELEEGWYQQSVNFAWFIWFTILISHYCMKLFCLPPVWRLLQADVILSAQHCQVTGLLLFSARTRGATGKARPSWQKAVQHRIRENRLVTVPFLLTGLTGFLLLQET